jgi:hypothetical protein
MQMAANTGFLAMVGGAVPFVHFDELKETGEMLEKSLGIGRLTRQALRPLINQASEAARAQVCSTVPTGHTRRRPRAKAKLSGRMSDGRGSDCCTSMASATR